MKKIFFILFVFISLALFSQVQGLYINEFMASNSTAYADDNGEYDDWIEIYNASNEPIDIGGMYITDDLNDLTLYQIPDTDPDQTTIEPEDFLSLWADKHLNQGILHVNIKLSSGGEEIGLVESDGTTIVDQIVFGAQTTDVSYGRYPDGSDHWEFMPQYTPGYENESSNMPPVLESWQQIPLTPMANQDVTVRITATDTRNITEINLIYDEDGDIHTLTMYDDGEHNDFDANDNIYAATIPGMGNGTEVQYYIQAIDDFDTSTYFPQDYQENKIKYVCGYTPPNLKINEFMADNATIIQDPQGEYEDWIEIYNDSNQPIDIGGFYITDNLGDFTQWYKIPQDAPESTTIEPYGFLLLWADKDEDDGVTHLDFKLSSSGESIGIFAFYGTTPVDTLSFGEQTTDISYGRNPNGSNNWQYFTNPTPGASNVGSAIQEDHLSVINSCKNYPNPFNPKTTISFSLVQKSKVLIEIYNLKGEKVSTVLNKEMTSGEHFCVWNGTDDNHKKVGTGIYLYKIKTKNSEFTGKMLLLK